MGHSARKRKNSGKFFKNAWLFKYYNIKTVHVQVFDEKFIFTSPKKAETITTMGKRANCYKSRRQRVSGS